MTISLVPAQKLGLPIISVDGGLRLLPDKTPCMGFQCCCVCPDCRERLRLQREREAREPIRQPWECAA